MTVRLKNPTDGEIARISLVRAQELKGLPPATVITAEMNLLRPEGEMSADRLRELGYASTIGTTTALRMTFLARMQCREGQRCRAAGRQ
jgi:acetyl esterase